MQWYLDNEDWWRALQNRAGVGAAAWGQSMKLLVFGKSGQVASELAGAARRSYVWARAQADLSDPDVCAAAIRAHAPSGVINAAAYTAVDKAEEEEALATVINADAPSAMALTCAELGIPFVNDLD